MMLILSLLALYFSGQTEARGSGSLLTKEQFQMAKNAVEPFYREAIKEMNGRLADDFKLNIEHYPNEIITASHPLPFLRSRLPKKTVYVDLARRTFRDLFQLFTLTDVHGELADLARTRGIIPGVPHTNNPLLLLLRTVAVSRFTTGGPITSVHVRLLVRKITSITGPLLWLNARHVGFYEVDLSVVAFHCYEFIMPADKFNNYLLRTLRTAASAENLQCLAVLYPSESTVPVIHGQHLLESRCESYWILSDDKDDLAEKVQAMIKRQTEAHGGVVGVYFTEDTDILDKGLDKNFCFYFVRLNFDACEGERHRDDILKILPYNTDTVATPLAET